MLLEYLLKYSTRHPYLRHPAKNGTDTVVMIYKSSLLTAPPMVSLTNMYEFYLVWYKDNIVECSVILEHTAVIMA